MIEHRTACNKEKYLIDNMNVILIQGNITNDAIKFKCDIFKCPDKYHIVNYNKEEYIFEEIVYSRCKKYKMYKTIDVMHVCWTSSQSDYYLLERDNIKITDEDSNERTPNCSKFSSIIDRVYNLVIYSDYVFPGKYVLSTEKTDYNFNIIVEFKLCSS